MVERRVCSFCGAEIEPGTGKLYVKKDGMVLAFDSNKCYKNMIELGRVPRRTSWTRAFAKEKGTRLKLAPVAEEKPQAAEPVAEPAAPVQEKESPAEQAAQEPAKAEKPKEEKKAEKAKAPRAKKTKKETKKE